MNRFILSALSLFWILTLTTPASPETPNCQTGNTLNNAYIQRDNDKRCEGTTTPNVSRNDFGLRSFVIGQIPDAKILSLTIPKLANLPEPPILRVQSTEAPYYQLDPLELKADRKQWRFAWPNTILKEEGIPFSQLRSLAEVGNTQRIVLPVRFSSSSNYDIRIYTGNRTQAINLKILDPKGKTVYTQTKRDQPGTEVAFTWNGTAQNKPTPAGRYTLRIDATIERPNSKPESRQSTRQFEHNPLWLR
jgi:hypothetical protein